MQRRERPLSWFIIGAIAALFSPGVNLAQENIDWKDRLFAEAPKCWVNYVRFARTLQITVTGKIYSDPDRSRELAGSRAIFKQSKGAFLRVQEIDPKSKLVQGQIRRMGQATVAGTNSSYSFDLKRRSPDSGWIIADLELSNQSNTFSDEQKKLQEKFLRKICDCLELEDLWLPTLIQDPDFKITAVKTQEIDGARTVRFDFDYPKAVKDYPATGGMQIRKGWMILDPGHDWILREYVGHHYENPEVYYHTILQIREGSNRHPIVIHTTRQVVVEGGKPGHFSEAYIQAVEQSDVPLEEFTLSAFGLPEPPGTQVNGSRLHLWIALVGIVSLGIAAVIRWQLRRTRTVG